MLFPKTTSFQKRLGLYACCVALSLAALLPCGEETKAVAGEPSVQEGQTGEAIGALAWIEPKSRVLKIGAPNMLEGARVESLAIEEGEVVKKGQLIGTFSTYKKNKAAYEAAKSGLALAQARLEKVLAGNKQSDIQSQRQVVGSIRASETAASKEFLRIKDLYRSGFASEAKLDEAKANRDRLTAERKSAEELLTSLELVRPDDVAIAKAEVALATSQVEVAQAALDLSSITAPIDGTIITIYTHPSESVGNKGVLDIADLNVMDAVAEVDENDILKIRKGQRAEISVPGFDYRFSGSVRDLGGQIKRNSIVGFESSQALDTRVVEIRIQLDADQAGVAKRLINKKVHAKILL